MTFAEQLKAARLAAGLSQAATAEKTGIPKRSIENWEGGKNTPPAWAQRYILAELDSWRKDK